VRSKLVLYLYLNGGGAVNRHGCEASGTNVSSGAACINAPIGDSGEAERLFRTEVERHSGMIPNTIGAWRRWQLDCAVKRSASSRETCPQRSGGTVPQAEKGVRGKGGSLCPRLSTQWPWSANSAPDIGGSLPDCGFIHSKLSAGTSKGRAHDRVWRHALCLTKPANAA